MYLRRELGGALNRGCPLKLGLMLRRSLRTTQTASTGKSDDLKKNGGRVLDWAAEYVRTLDQRPVAARVQPGYLRKLLPAAPPEQPTSLEEILADLERFIMPGVCCAIELVFASALLGNITFGFF